MTDPRRLPPHTRQLAQLINRPGGLTVEEAVAAAEQSLAGLQGRALSDMAQTVRGMQATLAAIGPDGDPAQATELYRRSDSLIGPSGLFAVHGVGDVAMSLCTLIERLQLARQWNADAVRVHIESLRQLLQADMKPPHAAAVVAALHKLVDRLLPTAVA